MNEHYSFTDYDTDRLEAIEELQAMRLIPTEYPKSTGEYADEEF